VVEGEKRVRVETGDVTRTAKIIFNLSNDLVVATNHRQTFLYRNPRENDASIYGNIKNAISYA